MAIKILSLLSFLILVGCTSGVKPWAKGNLAKPSMSFNNDPGESQFRAHVYQSKEGSLGGLGGRIGNCGCN
jgi:hypothetical protein